MRRSEPSGYELAVKTTKRFAFVIPLAVLAAAGFVWGTRPERAVSRSGVRHSASQETNSGIQDVDARIGRKDERRVHLPSNREPVMSETHRVPSHPDEFRLWVQKRSDSELRSLRYEPEFQRRLHEICDLLVQTGRQEEGKALIEEINRRL